MKITRVGSSLVAVTALSVVLAMTGGGGAASTESEELTPVASDGSTRVDKTYVDATGVVHYVYDPADRPGARYEVERGSQSAKGCSFYVEGTGSGQTGHITIVDEVSYDPATCVRTVSVATYPVEAVPAAVEAEFAPQAGVEYERASQTGQTARIGGASSNVILASWWQKLSAWVSDPIGIHVTETKIARSWNSSGGWHNDYTWGWYSPSGWSRTSSGTTGNSTTGDTRGSYINWAFGAQNEATYSDHTRTKLTTNSSGGWDWGYTMNKYGEADELLSYHYAFG